MVSVRHATLNDNDGLLQLTAQTPMAGLLPLIIDRKPDFFALQQLRGPGVVLVAEDDGTIVGTMNVTHLTAWSRGRKIRVDYLCDLKVAHQYRGKRALAMLLRGVRDIVMPDPPDAVLCVIARGNTLAEHVVSGRIGMPAFQKINEFSVRQLLPRRKRRTSHERYEIREVQQMDQHLCDFFNERYATYAFAPRVEVETELSRKSRYLTAWDGNQMVGAMAILDTRSVKQNIVVKIPWYLRLLRGVMNSVPESLGTPRLPGVGEPIQILYARLWACAPGQEQALHGMIARARAIARDTGCHFLSIAACAEQDAHLKPYFSITFHSQLFGTTATGNGSVIEEAAKGLVFEDFSLV